MTSLADKIMEAVGRNFGRGWFYHAGTGKLHEMDAGSLGPHGDHDCWISIADHAKAIGVDPKKSKAFQDAQFGFEVPESHHLAKYSEFGASPGKKYIDPNGGPDHGQSWDQFKTDLDTHFKKTHGMTHDDAMGLTFPELVRVRHWPRNNSLSIDMEDDHMHKLPHLHDELIKSGVPEDIPVNVFHEGNMYKTKMHKLPFIDSVPKLHGMRESVSLASSILESFGKVTPNNFDWKAPQGKYLVVTHDGNLEGIEPFGSYADMDSALRGLNNASTKRNPDKLTVLSWGRGYRPDDPEKYRPMSHPYPGTYKPSPNLRDR